MALFAAIGGKGGVLRYQSRTQTARAINPTTVLKYCRVQDIGRSPITGTLTIICSQGRRHHSQV